MIKKISLALALNLALFSGAAVAASGNNYDFGVDLMLSVEDYSAGKQSTATAFTGTVLAGNNTMLHSGYNGTGGTYANSMTYGIGLKGAYYNGFAILGDASYRMATLAKSGSLSSLNIATASGAGVFPHSIMGTDVTIDTNAYSNLKGKIAAGYGFEMGAANSGSYITPFVGLSYKNKAQTVATPVSVAATSPQTGITLNVPSFVETNTLIGIPLGINVKVLANDSLGFEVQGAWHLLWSAQTSTPRTDVAGTLMTLTGAGIANTISMACTTANVVGTVATPTVYLHTGTGTSFTSNYTLELSGSVLWLMGNADFGIESIGFGFYYDTDSLSVSQVNTTAKTAVTAIANTAVTGTYVVAMGAGTTPNVTAIDGALEPISATEMGLKLSFNF